MMNEAKFKGWYMKYFGFGNFSVVGEAEAPIVSVLKAFFDIANRKDGFYNYSELEEKTSPGECWLLLNMLIQAGLVDWGSSARCGWIEPECKDVCDFVATHTAEQLCEIVNSDEDWAECEPWGWWTGLGQGAS